MNHRAPSTYETAEKHTDSVLEIKTRLSSLVSKGYTKHRSFKEKHKSGLLKHDLLVVMSGKLACSLAVTPLVILKHVASLTYPSGGFL